MYRGNIVSYGTNNSIKGGVLLQEIPLGPQIISGVFTAMSIVTGQYYLNQINNKLTSIKNQIDEVRKFLENDKKSIIESEEKFLRGVSENYESIVKNEDMKKAKLCNIQRIKIDSLANIIFYQKQIDDLLVIKPKTDKMEDILNNTQNMFNNISGYWYSLYLYSYASCLEIIIGNIYDEDYINNTINDLKEKCIKYETEYKEWYKKIDKYIQEAKAFDENKYLQRAKKATKIPIDITPSGLAAWLLIKNVVDKVDLKDKAIKKQNKGNAYGILQDMIPFSSITEIESNHEYLSLLTGKVEIVKIKEEMYIRIQNNRNLSN